MGLCSLGFVTGDNVDAPLIKLFEFEMVYVDIGQSVNVTLRATPYSISSTNQYGHQRIVPDKYNMLLGDYISSNYVTTTFCIDGMNILCLSLMLQDSNTGKKCSKANQNAS